MPKRYQSEGWTANFAGIGEKPGPTMKGWWRTGARRDGAKVDNTERRAHAVVEHEGNDERTSAELAIRNV